MKKWKNLRAMLIGLAAAAAVGLAGCAAAAMLISGERLEEVPVFAIHMLAAFAGGLVASLAGRDKLVWLIAGTDGAYLSIWILTGAILGGGPGPKLMTGILSTALGAAAACGCRMLFERGRRRYPGFRSR